uniref:Exocyst complex component 7 n=1 Tax=Heligmosomoides polygyrus TaxID=6339 RepID=A0A183FG41_HELPZ
LSTDTANHSLMFTFLLNVLQCPKYPMATKYLQVKLYYLEGEIVSLLQTVNVGGRELEQLREAAVQMANAVACQIVPPIALAHFILDRLSYVFNVCEVDQSGQPNSRVVPTRLGARRPQDDDLALKAALDAVGARPLFSDEDYPLLSEAVRRQKGELTIALLTRHRDSTEKLGLILDRLLDPSIHKMYSWHQSNAAYFLDRDPVYLKRGQRGQRPVFPFPPHSPPVVRRRFMPVVSTTEAHAHYMHELAKRVLTEAGGSQSSVVFAPIGQNPLGMSSRSSNRKLHMCAFLIGMYAIGLHNQVCTSWRSRTYSTHVSWINLQAAELGLMAIEVVRETWPTHLTPSEAAGLADKAGQSRDPAVVEEAARLALSVLPYAYTLSAAETQRALLQCREQGSALLENACRAIEEPTSHAQQQQQYYYQTPPYAEDIRWLFTISVQLGTPYFVSFLDAVAKAVSSPFLLFQFAMEANTRLPPYPQQYSMPPMNRSVPPPQPSHSTKAFAHAHQLLVAAIAAFMRIPHAPTAHTLLEDFYRHVKKQKAWKKDVQHRLGALLHEALNQQR